MLFTWQEKSPVGAGLQILILDNDMTETNVILAPLQVKYNGLDTDNHLIDGIYFGKSIEGTAKLYNQVLYLFEHGKVPGNRSKYRLRIYTGIPEKGSVDAFFYSLMQFGQFAAYPELWKDVANWFVPEVVKATMQKLLNKESESQKTLDKMIELVKHEGDQNRAFNKEVMNMAIGAICADKSRLYDVIENLADSNRVAVRNIADPVGRSCATVQHQIGSRTPLYIDEPSAEVLRSKEKLEVADMETYKGYIRGVDKDTGSCKVILEGEEYPISGKITDPSLTETGNIYTRALDTDTEIEFDAKATIKNSKIQRLFISDARTPD